MIEAWSIDSPQHGHSARLNERALLELPDGLGKCRYHKVSWRIYANILEKDVDQWNAPINTLLQSDLIAGDRVVSIGHSAGSVSL